MKNKEQIEEELQRHKQSLKSNKKLNKIQKYIHECYIEALEWVLKEDKKLERSEKSGSSNYSNDIDNSSFISNCSSK